MNAPESGKAPPRAAIIALTVLADIAGTVLIVWVLPLSWTTRIIVVAVWLSVTNSASRLYLRRLSSR
jgi:hypothetical protein